MKKVWLACVQRYLWTYNTRASCVSSVGVEQKAIFRSCWKKRPRLCWYYINKVEDEKIQKFCLNIGYCNQRVFLSGLRTRTRKNSIILPNSNLNSKKYFFWTRTRIKLFEFIRRISKLLKRNKRSPRNIVCCSIVTTTPTISTVRY